MAPLTSKQIKANKMLNDVQSSSGRRGGLKSTSIRDTITLHATSQLTRNRALPFARVDVVERIVPSVACIVRIDSRRELRT